VTLPDNIVHQFRTVALERLERVEAAWASVLTSLDEDAIVLIDREIHTLKGESRMVGFTDVNLVCHKLEDLFEVARACGYAVAEDFDLAITMALRFMAMLVRKKVGSQLAGIDLPGFVRQIEHVLSEARGEVTPARARNITPMHRTAHSSKAVSPAVRGRLAPIAVDMFLEYAAARGNHRNRLRVSWHSLRDLVGIHRALIGTGQLIKHEVGAYALAKELGKQIEVAIEIGGAEVTTDVLAALDLAVLHLVRNAIDHGIELPAERAAACKRATGKIRVGGGAIGDVFELVVEDDGAGIAYGKVRQRAGELGLSAPATDDDDRWIDLLCHPGLSTRAEATDVSGRGVGLDAARASIVDVGGKLSMTSKRGEGTRWRIAIPLTSMMIEGHVVRPPEVPVSVFIESSWAPTTSGRGTSVDLGRMLGFSTGDHPCVQTWFARGDEAFGIGSERPATPTQARKLVVTPSSAIAEVVTIDGVESLLLRPDVLIALG